jgi:ABC-type polysaccharide transport system permease subunit
MLYDIAYKFLSYVMVLGFLYEVLCIRTGILNLVLASTTVSF